MLAVILLGYMAASFAALWWVKPDSPSDSLRLMIAMTPVRLAALASLWAAARREGRPVAFDFAGEPRAAAAGGAAMLALWALFLTGSSGEPWTWAQALAGLGVCATVGVFEEFAFRGAVLEACLRRWPPGGAALVSSLLFTLYHCRPQAIPAWTHIFLTGLVFAHLRLRGLGLGWLALIHAAVDGLFFFAGSLGVQDHGPSYYVFLAGLFAFAAATAPKKEAGAPFEGARRGGVESA